MRVVSALVAVAGLLTAVPAALATITITGPSPSAYWVQNTSNQITWDFTQGDPKLVSITVTNPNSTALNGVFAIAENVDLSNKSFTVTRVTLKVDSGYFVNIVNSSNITQAFAQSGAFDVKAPGTPTVSQALPSATSPSSSSANGNGTSPSGSGNGSATASGATGSASNKSNASLRSIDGSLMTLAPMLGLSALMSVLGALATL